MQESERKGVQVNIHRQVGKHLGWRLGYVHQKDYTLHKTASTAPRCSTALTLACRAQCFWFCYEPGTQPNDSFWFWRTYRPRGHTQVPRPHSQILLWFCVAALISLIESFPVTYVALGGVWSHKASMGLVLLVND